MSGQDNYRTDQAWDVIVVGATVAGAATAMLLARAGLRVLCLDRSRHVGDTVSTHALMRGGVLQLRRWGLLNAVTDAGTPPVRRAVYHYGADSDVVSIRPSSGVDALYAPRRTVLDALLVDAAQQAGATVEFGAAVTGLDRFYRPGVTAAAIPTNNGLTCVFVGAQAARNHELVNAPSPLAAFHLLADPAGIGSRIRAATRAEPVRYVRALPPGYLRPAFGPGWALVGNAGHWIDPISTHGTAVALRDAELLSRAVLSAPQDGAKQQSALAGYQAIRDRLSLPMLQVTEEIASYQWDLTRIRTLLRTLSSAMTDEVEALAGLAPVTRAISANDRTFR